MTSRKNERHDLDLLRRHAEDNRESIIPAPEIMEALSPEAARRLLDELRVHQLELEMQNEELRRDITEQKRAAEALRESETLYFALAQNSTASIILRDESGLITYANESFARMMQADAPTELVGRSYVECVHPDDREGSRRRIAIDIAGIPSPLREHRLVSLQGQTIFVESTGVPIIKGGRPYVMGVFHDVTDRKRAENALRESEERFRSFVENANDIVYSLTLNGIFTYVSPNWKEILGHENSEIMGHSFADFVHPDDHPIGYAFLERMFVTGEKQGGLVYRIRHKNGDWKWQTINATPMRDATGKIVSFLGISRDITEHRQAEEAIKSSQARYHALMEQSFEALAVVDIQTQQVMEVNRRFTELFGYSLPQDAPLLVDTFAIEPDSDKNGYPEEMRKMVVQQRVLPTATRDCRHKNGTLVPVERAGSVIPLDGRDYLLVSMRDLTDERRGQAQLKRDVELARRVQRGLLPELPKSPFVTLRTLYHPAHFVSGDSYHLEWHNEGKLLRGFLIDVSGHGLATAIQTSSINVLLREAASMNLPLLGQLGRVNARAAKYFTDGAYAAILGFELDLSLRELRYVGAGITQFYANGKKVETPGMFVGIWDDAEFTPGSVPVTTGDCFHFLTDGLTDWLSLPENTGFWSHGGKGFDTDVMALEKLADSGMLRDDATAVCFKIKGSAIGRHQSIVYE